MRRICMDGYALRITRSGAQDAPVSLGIIKLTLYRQVVDWRVANITHRQLGKGQLFYSVRNTVSLQVMCVGPLIKMIPVCQLKGARLDSLVRLVRWLVWLGRQSALQLHQTFWYGSSSGDGNG